MSGEILSLVMFAVACGVLILGFPVAFSLAGTGLAFALLAMPWACLTCRFWGRCRHAISG